jgi:hypothetical protein
MSQPGEEVQQGQQGQSQEDHGLCLCERCGKHLEVGDFPFCRGTPADHVTSRRQLFKKVSVEIDGVTHEISSIQDANRLEREYARRAASDPSVAPVAFRAFHQSQSNQDANCFGPSPQQAISKQRRAEAIRHGAREPDAPLHPAVRRIYGRG